MSPRGRCGGPLLIAAMAAANTHRHVEDPFEHKTSDVENSKNVGRMRMVDGPLHRP